MVAAFILLAGLIIAGCCSFKDAGKDEVEFKTNTIMVPVPPIVDTLEAKADTVRVYGEKIIEKDTVIKVEYFPKEKKIYLKVKPDPVVVIKVDTVHVYRTTEVVKAAGFFEKEFWYIAGFLFLLIILFIAIKIKI